MKTVIIALAATVLTAGTALASNNNSFSNGDGFDRQNHVVDQTLFGGTVLDFEPTASIGVVGAGNDVRIDRHFDGGREVIERFTINPDGSRNVLSKSYGSSDR